MNVAAAATEHSDTTLLLSVVAPLAGLGERRTRTRGHVWSWAPCTFWPALDAAGLQLRFDGLSILALAAKPAEVLGERDEAHAAFAHMLHGADAHAMPQPSAHELPMTGMPSTGSASAEKARPGSIQSLFYPTAAPRGTPPGV